MDELQRTAEAIASSFNYAVLSAEMGDYLKRKEQQLKNEYMNFTANCGAIFAEAQEKLAGNNQYNGMFEKWIVSMGFSKKTVYRMIDIHKFCSCQIDTSKQETFDALPKMLQYDISAPSAPPQLVERVMNGDITTHKEYIKLKRELEESKVKIAELEDDEREWAVENKKLTDRIKDLESRPVEATYTSLDECFDTPSGTEKFTDLYETLYHKILEAIYDCVNFIMDDELPYEARRYARIKFMTIGDEYEKQCMLIEEEN